MANTAGQYISERTEYVQYESVGKTGTAKEKVFLKV